MIEWPAVARAAHVANASPETRRATHALTRSLARVLNSMPQLKQLAKELRADTIYNVSQARVARAWRSARPHALMCHPPSLPSPFSPAATWAAAWA